MGTSKEISSAILQVYTYVNMSNRVSIVKTDFGWSEEWLQEVIIVQKASLYIYKIEKTLKKIIAISEDRTPTVAEKCLSDNRCNRSAKPDIYL